jgi:hypothetical protein
MKMQADKKRSDRVFQAGDRVFMKLQPYIQSSVAPRAHHKLLFKYYGPYTVLERVGEAAYRLQLPPRSRIHPVLHVSQLNQALGPHCQVQTDLPDPDASFVVPVRVLQRRFRRKDSKLVPQALIQWSDQPDVLATWEDLEELQQRFPRAPAWGQAAFQGRGDVSDSISPPASLGEQAGPSTSAQPMKRTRRPSQRYSSSDWVVALLK